MIILELAKKILYKFFLIPQNYCIYTQSPFVCGIYYFEYDTDFPLVMIKWKKMGEKLINEK